MAANEATVRANPDRYSEVGHLRSVRLVHADLSCRHRDQTWTNPVASPAEGTFGSRDPLGYRLQDALGTVRHQVEHYTAGSWCHPR